MTGLTRGAAEGGPECSWGRPAATPSSASLGAKPCPQAAQWYQVREMVTAPSTVSKVFPGRR
jgi:hypothetical protein